MKNIEAGKALDYLSKDLIGDENFDERLRRFKAISENEDGNWDLSDRDQNALRTANALIEYFLSGPEEEDGEWAEGWEKRFGLAALKAKEIV